ncbi:DUF4125 family protein [Anaerococcus porci]|uniref:DUF4125 family protein n=1 Tax=Anaerococcus porci TaxID=2652269 RepID=UPI002A759E79|nr:DUF4125 family protein [Anaerococcus porci]MDY3006309.1 DUF4125 family protein [Anaerococcus porci]
MRDIFLYVDKEKLDEIYKEKNISKESRAKINFIVNFEWDQFDKVKGLNGRESCQDSPIEFMIMRLAQYLSYDRELISLIFDDMAYAKDEKFNPIYDKYARMMEYTDKKNFEKIKKSLNYLSPVKRSTLLSIKNALQNQKVKLPDKLEKVRPEKSESKRISSTDYFICEISFMSLKTLWKIEELVKMKNHNLVEKIYQNTIYLYKRLNYGVGNER